MVFPPFWGGFPLASSVATELVLARTPCCVCATAYSVELPADTRLCSCLVLFVSLFRYSVVSGVVSDAAYVLVLVSTEPSPTPRFSTARSNHQPRGQRADADEPVHDAGAGVHGGVFPSRQRCRVSRPPRASQCRMKKFPICVRQPRLFSGAGAGVGESIREFQMFSKSRACRNIEL